MEKGKTRLIEDQDFGVMVRVGLVELAPEVPLLSISTTAGTFYCVRLYI